MKGSTVQVAGGEFDTINSSAIYGDRHKEHPLGETIKSRVMAWLTLKY